MKMCVGAVSQRVVEVAAELNVAEIIASRRQVDIGGGYTGYDQKSLVEAVRSRSSTTKVVRDHGGPYQSGIESQDDWMRSFRYDIEAGFDWLHVDVCKLMADEQAETLHHIVTELDYPVEVGGEHDSQVHNAMLLSAALQVGVPIRYCVLQTGAKIHADQQVGYIDYMGTERSATYIRQHGVQTKAHNQDWNWHRRELARHIDACNIAPEFARVETEACLQVMSFEDADELLRLAHESGAWRRWFDIDEGTIRDQAVCAVRYIVNRPDVRSLMKFDTRREEYVRAIIKDAILCG